MSSIAGMLVCFAFGGLSLLFLASYVGAGQRKEKVRKQRRADLFVGAAFGAALMAVFDKALFIIVPTVYRWYLGASAEVGPWPFIFMSVIVVFILLVIFALPWRNRNEPQ